jgi:hypothetical protein
MRYDGAKPFLENLSAKFDELLSVSVTQARTTRITIAGIG